MERPASVVKELLENALDAGATQITIQVEAGGQELIEVADDGQGIPPGEIDLAVARHATSKLTSADDLFTIQTLGFRGEALASIGSVSRLTLTSRGAGQPTAMRLRVEGGQIFPAVPVGAPQGTVVRVENLFYNVPARRKFLKQESSERRVIDTLVTQYALAYPQVRFHLRQEGRTALQTTGNGNRREVLAALYGVDIARQMIEVIAREDHITILGFTSPTSLTRANRREIVFFVNGRPVQDSSLTTAVIQAYHTLLMVGRFPLSILFLELPPEEVDVNVHPAKAEVRFRDARILFSALQRAVRRALLTHTPVPDLKPGLSPSFPFEDRQRPGEGFPIGSWPARPGAPLSASTPANQVDWGRAADDQSPVAPPDQPGTARQPVLPGHPPLLRLVGQIATAYLVAEGPDGLYLIDQHAAHERVLFERLMAQHTAAAGVPVPSQPLLAPVVVELPPSSAQLLQDQLSMLAHLGFVVEPFGPGAFQVRALPLLLAYMDPAAAVRVAVEDFEEDETPLQAEIEERIAARVCKRAAVKAGQVLSPVEQQALLDDLQACNSPRTCPHGRPTMIYLSVDILERQFGRKGAR